MLSWRRDPVICIREERSGGWMEGRGAKLLAAGLSLTATPAFPLLLLAVMVGFSLGRHVRDDDTRGSDGDTAPVAAIGGNGRVVNG